MNATDPNAAVPPEWRAFGPEKEAWKRAGNYYTNAELDCMERAAMRELSLQPSFAPPLSAD